METLFEKVTVARNFLENHLDYIPENAIILGTGLGKLVNDVVNPVHIPYRNIPHFPTSTAPSHAGEMVIGRIEDKEVILLNGRFHYYEGYSAEDITFPIRLLKDLGVKNLIITNAAGGINPHFETGDIVTVHDHINFIPDHPLRGPNDERFGPRFPDMMEAYNPQLLKYARKAYENLGLTYKSGIYVALQGPSLETPAEYKFARIIGGDLVGMSTVPEVIMAHYCGIRTLVFSLVSNVCFPLTRLTETTVEEVVETAEKATPRLTSLIKEVIRHF
jgi:purine-nucleoside phosphorylase